MNEKKKEEEKKVVITIKPHSSKQGIKPKENK